MTSEGLLRASDPVGNRRALIVAGLLAVNREQRMRATFSAGGVQVAVPGGHVSLALSGVGRGNAIQPAIPVAPVARANRVSYGRAGLVEWYANGPLGLEQGVTLHFETGRRSCHVIIVSFGAVKGGTASSRSTVDSERS